MSTLADLQTRIINETNRDDLADALASSLNQAINDAISDYANERFWFNELRVSGTFSAGLEYSSLPSGQYLIDAVYITVGSVQFPLLKKSMEEIENLYLIPQVGQPYLWAAYMNLIRMWPTPNRDYASTWLTVSDVTPLLDFTQPSSLTLSSNYWTNQGQWLICSRAKMFLYQNVFKDPDAFAGAQLDNQNAYANIKMQSNRQLATGRMHASW
jgi:hypothetical protein